MSECLLDFPHAAVHCPACWADLTQVRIANEARRANDLKERELLLRDQRSDDENYWRPTPKPIRYIPAPAPPAQQQNEKGGGIGIEPRQRKSL